MARQMVQMPIDTLKNITKNFSDTQKVGSGGYGEVYKAYYEGKEIAVKLLHPLQGIDDEQFINEIHNHIKAQHPNIVRFIGYCKVEEKEFIVQNDSVPVFGKHIFKVICFEYMHGGSLDKHLLENSLGVDWTTHYNIIKGVCEGLYYLHRKFDHPILHLDLKPSNILLDAYMNPKIADFGLSRIYTASRSHITVEVVRGKYMPPELRKGKQLSEQSDIFSLGVTIIDIIAGLHGFDDLDDLGVPEFIDKVITAWRSRTENLSQVETCIKLAIRCVDKKRNNRPTIEQIVDTLKSEIENPTGNKVPPIVDNNPMGRMVDKVHPTVVDEICAPKKIRSSASKDLIRVEPVEYIFPMEPKNLLWLLNKIVNITDDYVAFRIYSKGRVTANYYLPVQRGILAPRSSTEFRFARLSRENQPETGEGKEFRVVRSTVVSKDTNISDVSEDLFDYPEVAAAAGIFVHEVKQPIFVVPPPGEQSLEVTKHSIPLVSPTGSNETKYEISSSISNELIQVDPLEFIFPLEPKKLDLTIRVVNITPYDHVAFLVRTLSVKGRYTAAVGKDRGVLSPQSSVDISYTREPRNGAPTDVQSEEELLCVDCTVVSEDFKAADISVDMFEISTRTENRDFFDDVFENSPEGGGVVYYPGRVKLRILLIAPTPQSWEVIPPDSQPGDTSSQMWQLVKNDSGITWVNSIDVHPTEPWIITTQHDPYVRIWNYQTQEVTRLYLGASPGFAVTSVKFIPSSQWIVAGATDGLIYLYSYDQLDEMRIKLAQIHALRAHSQSINSLAIHASKPYVLSASFGQIQLRDYEEQMELLMENSSERTWSATCVTFDPTGTAFASVCGNLIKIWNLDTAECKLELKGHLHEVTCLEYFTYDHKVYLISGSQDTTAKIWDCQSGSCVRTLKVYSPVRVVCSHPHLPILITGSCDGSVRLWNSNTLR